MKILWTMSSVGLGHQVRDLVIIDKITENTDIKIDLLVPAPNTDKIPKKYNVLEESYMLKGSGRVYYQVFEKCRDKFDLLNFIKEDAKFHQHDFAVTAAVLNTNQYSAIVGDEAFWLLSGFGMKWDKKRIPFIYITDFITMKAMDRSLSKKLFAWYKNWQFSMSGNVSDLSLFIGSINDIPDKKFGCFLPHQRQWAARYFQFIHPVLRLDQNLLEDQSRLRKRLHLPINKEIYLAVISGVGNYTDLQQLISQTFKRLKMTAPEAYFIVVSPQKNGVYCDEHFAYLDNLDLYFKAADFVITQTGYGKIVELSALNKPFISIPLDYHFEQEYLLRLRIDNYQIGSQILLRKANPEFLLNEINKQKERANSNIVVDDGTEAAKIIVDFVEKRQK